MTRGKLHGERGETSLDYDQALQEKCPTCLKPATKIVRVGTKNTAHVCQNENCTSKVNLFKVPTWNVA